MNTVRYGVIPAAHLGDGMRPATTAVPHALLPIGGRPVLDWLLDEACDSGLEGVVVVSTAEVPAVDAYISASRQAGDGDERRDRTSEQEQTREQEQNGRRLMEVRVARGSSLGGIADAVQLASREWGGESLAVLQADAVMLGGPSLLEVMIDEHVRTGESAVGLKASTASSGGSEGRARITGEELSRAMSPNGHVGFDAPSGSGLDAEASRSGVCGRYVFGSDLISALVHPPPGGHGDARLVEIIDAAARERRLVGIAASGSDGHFDVGGWAGWLAANEHTFESSSRALRITD